LHGYAVTSDVKGKSLFKKQGHRALQRRTEASSESSIHQPLFDIFTVKRVSRTVVKGKLPGEPVANFSNKNDSKL
jgi:hypothetical protein